MPSQWDCFCLFSWFLKAELLNCQALKQRVLWDEGELCYTQLLLCRYSRHYEQDLFTLPSDLCRLTWISAPVCNDLLQIKIKNYNTWMLFYHKFRPSQRSNQENKFGSWQHILFWKNMLHYENSVWWSVLKRFQDFTWPPPTAMKKMLTHKWLLDWKTLYIIFYYIGYAILSQSYTCNNWRHQTSCCIQNQNSKYGNMRTRQ